MKRYSSIAVLFFYIAVSIGVHVDVDTCCNSIAGLSVFTEKTDHSVDLDDDCCISEAITPCCSADETTKEGCPSDCVFIQILQHAPQVSTTNELAVHANEIEAPFVATCFADIPFDYSVRAWNEEPPSLATSEKFFLHFSSHITYG